MGHTALKQTDLKQTPPQRLLTAIEPLFEQAADQWSLDRLYADLAVAKKQVMPHRQPQLTKVEQVRLRGLLTGHSPARITQQQYTATKTVEVALCQGLYRYIEVLTRRDRNALTSWRNVASWLAEARYRRTSTRINWDQRPNLGSLYGRQAEQDKLQQLILGSVPSHPSPCRLVTVSGANGIGKTALVTTTINRTQSQFDSLIWQSLRHKPSLESVLSQWLVQLPPTSNTVKTSPQPTEWYDKLSALMNYFRENRCLVVIDNLESIFSSAAHQSSTHQYEAGYQDYCEFLKRLGEEQHQSCVVVTTCEISRETYGSLATTSPVRSLRLKGLQPDAAERILASEGLLERAYWQQLIELYRGNPLMLKLAARYIIEIFEGKVSDFLKQKKTLFSELESLIAQQYKRLSCEEIALLKQLAQHDQPIPISTLDTSCLAGLLRRSLVEKSAAGISLVPVVAEYIRHAKR